jgi:GT2 family glycosyltransferase/ADP-heptose:LPS heptosyltransferase/glycosyltransferase involved in cell wall biosynthesis
MYRPLAERFPEPHRVVGVPLRRYWALSKSEPRLDTLFGEFRDALDNLHMEAPDSVYVLNRSEAATRFAEMLRPKEMYGFRGDRIAPDSPMAYLETMLADPSAAPAHLADLWAALAGAPISPPEYPPPLGNQFLSALPRSKKRLGIFVGAGDLARTCPPEYWINFLSSFGDTSEEIVLFGTERDSEAAKQIEKFCRIENLRVCDAVARTDLLSLGSVLSSCNLVVGSDTGGIHFAAALGVPVLGIFFAGARAMFTGPYAACARVIEAESASLGSAPPSPHDVALVAAALLNGDDETISQLTPGLALRFPMFDRWGLLYQNPNERNPILAAARGQLENDLARPYYEKQDVPRQPQKRQLTIIIPAVSQAHLTRECLAAISEECRDLSAEILVNTAETSATQETLSTELCEVKTIQVSEGSSFACLCNQGAKEATGELLVFLNNDTLAERGWLKSLLASYSENAPCILSPLLLYWDGLVQNAGISFSESAIEEIAHGTWPEKSRGVVACDAVSGTTMLVSREIFERLGGFDEEYVNGYEDLDFCLRAGQQGIHCFVDCRARVRHFRGATPGRYQAEDQNRARFEQHWSQGKCCMKEKRLDDTPISAFTSDLHQEKTPLVCVVCAEEWWTAGSRVRWAGPFDRLQKIGMLRAQWYCIRAGERIWDRLSDDLARSSLVVLRRPLVTVSEHERLLGLVHHARVPLLVDMDDVFLARFPANSARGRARQALEESFIKMLEQAQIVTASTPTLAESCAQYCNKVQVLPNTVDSLWWPKAQNMRTARSKMAIGFFGSPLHGLDLANIAPALAKFLDEEKGRVRLFVWGAFPEVLRTHPQIRQGGPFVPEYEVHLQRLARRPVDLAVVPLLDSPANRCRSLIRFLELGWYGIPAVYSRVGEYESHLRNGQDGLLVGETTDEWLEALRTLSHDTQLRETIAKQARCTIQESWTIERYIKTYIEILHSLGIGASRIHENMDEKKVDALMEAASS